MSHSFSEDTSIGKSQLGSSIPSSTPTSSRWTKQEHAEFIKALEKYGEGCSGNEWTMISSAIGSKTEEEVKMHARRYLAKLEHERRAPDDLSETKIKNSSSLWTPQEIQIFETRLAQADPKAPDRWEFIAAELPSKSPQDVKDYYDWLAVLLHSRGAGVVGSLAADAAQGRGREGKEGRGKVVTHGQSWTEQEHQMFLDGLKIYGRGDWKSISRFFVPTRTPTQVASHAQKYFARQQAGKEKRREERGAAPGGSKVVRAG
eukprot:CAMPEP_0113664512 /NCGR_PEP_ID=MMETSP0038_2-20120614/1776_1 /TAXON_ID=2898 /ORGANISM="Cryptomonas paramecium" /LENGTH=259 /DNA_ID=CAMNT_0000579733 /DNA_START=56 /DNA_END=831 /DNA_ORIENTATION=+ /assembly_acc=CAM_ASM_000170